MVKFFTAPPISSSLLEEGLIFEDMAERYGQEQDRGRRYGHTVECIALEIRSWYLEIETLDFAQIS